MRALAPRNVLLGLVEARPVVQVIFLLRFCAEAVLGAAGGRTPKVGFPIAAAGWLCATYAVYLFNGMCDVVEDRANRSSRPIASGRLAVRDARTLVGASAAASLLLAACAGLPEVLLTVALLALGYAYSAGPYRLKTSVPGSVGTAAGLGVLTYADGYAAVDGSRPGRGLLFACAMTLWMACVGPSKDFSDVVGDTAAGRRTGCVVFGERRMRILIATLAPAVGTGFLAACVGLRDSFVLPSAVAVTAGGLAVAVITAPRPAGGDRGRLRRPYRAYMVTQYASHLLLLLRLAGAAAL